MLARFIHYSASTVLPEVAAWRGMRRPTHPHCRSVCERLCSDVGAQAALGEHADSALRLKIDETPQLERVRGRRRDGEYDA